MKKITKIAAFVLAIATMAASMTACVSKSASSSASSVASTASTAAQTTVDKIKANGYITMSTNAEFEPFEYKDGGKFAGIDIEISQKIADKLGVKLKINDVKFDSLIAELQSGKANFVAAGLTASEDRKKNVDFSNTYFKAAQSIIVKKGSTSVTKPTDLAGKVVGVQQGTTGDQYCTDEKKTNNVNVKTVKRYDKGMEAVSDLINGRVDAVVIDDFTAQEFVSKNPDKISKLTDALTAEEYAIAVKKGDTEMQKVVNDVLAGMKSDGSLDKLIEKYKSALEGK
ncbi:MAG TPA: transporter substrate-binding domain-containing protein [Oscillospiraceae bacterium]|nr:transporter substrate-binding domain-containing protein [Oscillospiraceae bacterium]